MLWERWHQLCSPPPSPPAQVDTITNITDRIGGLQAKSDEWRANIAHLERQLAERKQASAALPPPVDHKVEVQAMERESAELSNKVGRGVRLVRRAALLARMHLGPPRAAAASGARSRAPSPCPSQPSQMGALDADIRTLEDRRTLLVSSLGQIKCECGGPVGAASATLHPHPHPRTLLAAQPAASGAC
jgi:hypothetical protein